MINVPSAPCKPLVSSLTITFLLLLLILNRRFFFLPLQLDLFLAGLSRAGASKHSKNFPDHNKTSFEGRGSVYMGMNLDSGELLAVKQVLIAAKNVAKDKSQAHLRELEEEVKLLQNLSHPNIVRYLGTVREDDALNIFLEFVPGGSIASLLGKFGSFSEPVIRMYARQLLRGLEYLHSNGIMHRDIKIDILRL